MAKEMAVHCPIDRKCIGDYAESDFLFSIVVAFYADNFEYHIIIERQWQLHLSYYYNHSNVSIYEFCSLENIHIYV